MTTNSDQTGGAAYEARMTFEMGLPAGANITTPQEADQRAKAWANFTDVDPAIIREQALSRESISVEEREAALAQRRRMLDDREFVQKYMNGDQVARKQMALISIVLGRHVRRPEYD